MGTATGRYGSVWVYNGNNMGNNEIPKQHNKIVDSRRVVPSNMLDRSQF